MSMGINIKFHIKFTMRKKKEATRQHNMPRTEEKKAQKFNEERKLNKKQSLTKE